jgi:hypothetical protein
MFIERKTYGLFLAADRTRLPQPIKDNNGIGFLPSMVHKQKMILMKNNNLLKEKNKCQK